MPYDDQTITDLMCKFARREALTDEEMNILDEWRRECPENQQLVDEFGDLEWVKAEMEKIKRAPMDEIWEGINRHLDAIGAPDERSRIQRILRPVKGAFGWLLRRLRLFH